MHIEEFIGLPEPIPRTVVFPIHIYGTAIRFNCRVRVFHLDIFVAHECPSGEVCPIKLRSAPKVSNRLFVLSSQGVMVPYSQVRLFIQGRGKGETYQRDSIPLDGLCQGQESHVRAWKVSDGSP
jgi:hypothetical protein